MAEPNNGKRIKLSELKAILAPMSIDVDGLAQLGILPVGTKMAAKLYRECDIDTVCLAIMGHVQKIKARLVSRQAEHRDWKEYEMSEDSALVQAVKREDERSAFEADAAQYGFDLARYYCPVVEPWSEYKSDATGHRWAGWLAAKGVE